MEVVFYLLVIGIAVAFLLLLIDKQQDSGLSKTLKLSGSSSALFLLQSAERKLSIITTLLYGNITFTKEGNTITQSRININEGARQIIVSQLNMLVNDYKYGRILLRKYHTGLNEVFSAINKLKVLNLEQIK